MVCIKVLLTHWLTTPLLILANMRLSEKFSEISARLRDALSDPNPSDGDVLGLIQRASALPMTEEVLLRMSRRPNNPVRVFNQAVCRHDGLGDAVKMAARALRRKWKALMKGPARPSPPTSYLCSSPEEAGRLLDRLGVAVIPSSMFPGLGDIPDGHSLMTTAEFDGMIQSSPELSPEWSLGEPVVLGGFSGTCFSSVPHNLLVRRARIRHSKLMREMVGRGPSNVHFSNFDRAMYRPVGAAPTRESAHRDCPDKPIPGITTYGGWYNPCQSPQFFSCQPGSHYRGGTAPSGGFARLSEAERDEFKRLKVKIVVPPGHLLVFNETIKHEVAGKAQKGHPQRRIFLAHSWMPEEAYKDHCKKTGLPFGAHPLCPDLKERLEAGAVVPLKSGQMPPSYAKLHWTNWRPKLVGFAKKLHPACTTLRTVQAGPHAGEVLRVPELVMPSIRYLHAADPARFSMHVPYSPEELKYLFPNVPRD